uniref:G-protein coupled receptors family 1 profile domain-containing protein n=1 Tax=Noctiluca scintillans TaxID=2966 RepID=A0A7S1A6R6_NOCSC
MCRAPRSIRSRLLPTQLLYLAFSDICFLLASIPSAVVNHHMTNSVSDHWNGVLCEASVGLLSFWRNVSLSIEMHIAISFALESYRWRMGMFSRILRFIWIPSFVSSCCSFLFYPWHYVRLIGACAPRDHAFVADPYSILMMSSCICVCTVSYVLVARRSRKRESPESVQGVVSRRVDLYIVNALVTYSLTLIVYLDSRLYHVDAVRLTSFSMENLGGLINVLTYVLQSRYANVLLENPHVMVRSPRAAPLRPEYNVDIGHESIMEFSCDCPSNGHSPRSRYDPTQ